MHLIVSIYYPCSSDLFHYMYESKWNDAILCKCEIIVKMNDMEYYTGHNTNFSKIQGLEPYNKSTTDRVCFAICCISIQVMENH